MYIPILSKEDGKDQESIQSSTTPDPVRENDTYKKAKLKASCHVT